MQKVLHKFYKCMFHAFSLQKVLHKFYKCMFNDSNQIAYKPRSMQRNLRFQVTKAKDKRDNFIKTFD